MSHRRAGHKLRPHRPHPLTPYPPLIVNAALTGAVTAKARVAHLPVTSEEIVADGEACFAAGATLLHLHARDGAGRPQWRREAYAPVIAALRERCPGVVVCVTTSGRYDGDVAHRGDVLALEGSAKPDMASLTPGSMNFRDTASVTAPETIVALATRMRERAIKPELEIFDSGMAYVAHELLARGVLVAPLYANLLLGSEGTAPATGASLAHLVAGLPAGTCWAGAGIGAFALPMTGIAIFMGGHVRTGLEDSPYLDHASRAPATNAKLVERAVRIGRLAGRPPATAAQARAMLDLPPAQLAAAAGSG